MKKIIFLDNCKEGQKAYAEIEGEKIYGEITIQIDNDSMEVFLLHNYPNFNGGSPGNMKGYNFSLWLGTENSIPYYSVYINN